MSNTLSFWNTLAIELDAHFENIDELGETGVSESSYLLRNLHYFAKAFSNVATHNTFNQKYQEKLIEYYKESLLPYFSSINYHKFKYLLHGDVELESPLWC